MHRFAVDFWVVRAKRRGDRGRYKEIMCINNYFKYIATNMNKTCHIYINDKFKTKCTLMGLVVKNNQTIKLNQEIVFISSYYVSLEKKKNKIYHKVFLLIYKPR